MPTLLRLLKKADELDTDMVIIDGVTVRTSGGGDQIGLSPVDRGRPGTKRTLMVDPSGVPPAIRTAGANANDHRQIIPLVLKFPEVGGKPGRPERLPDDLYVERGYDGEDTREFPRWPGIGPPIAEEEDAPGERVGRDSVGGGEDDRLAEDIIRPGKVRPGARDRRPGLRRRR